MKTPGPSEASGVKMLTPRDAERNRLAGEWTLAHWNEIEDAWTSEDQADLKRRSEAWIEAGLAKFKG